MRGLKAKAIRRAIGIKGVPKVYKPGIPVELTGIWRFYRDVKRLPASMLKAIPVGKRTSNGAGVAKAPTPSRD
jgi:hypothetical protein